MAHLPMLSLNPQAYRKVTVESHFFQMFYIQVELQRVQDKLAAELKETEETLQGLEQEKAALQVKLHSHANVERTVSFSCLLKTSSLLRHYFHRKSWPMLPLNSRRPPPRQPLLPPSWQKLR